MYGNLWPTLYNTFWCQASGKYPLIWNEVRALVLSFLTSYLVEKGFSAVTLLLSKQRNLLFISKRGDLQLYLTKMSPNIKKLIEDHQAHPSHWRNTIYYDSSTFLSICCKFVCTFMSFSIAGERGGTMII